MKKVFIATLSAVTVLCIVVGTMVHVGGWFQGFSFGGDSGEPISYDEEQQEFRSLKIEADVMSVTIQKGDSYRISYEASEQRLAPKIELKGDILMITQSFRAFNFLRFGSHKCKMTLTVPEGVQLGGVEFDLDVGELILSDLSVDHMKIATDVGNVEMASCGGKRLEAESDVGNIDIRSSEFMDAEIETDVGNVSYSAARDLSSYDLTLATDIGKVTVDGESCKKQFNQAASADADKHRLAIETDTGSIDIVTAR